ncbi:MAG: prepilin-type N-terminal cleavage/methylation domain-containing protein, partial [Gammaproteobacteria bacterium]
MNIKFKGFKFKGFSLVELMVVLSILAIISAIGITKYTAYLKRAGVVNAANYAQSIKDRLMLYYADQEQFPTGANATEINNTPIDSNSRQYVTSLNYLSGSSCTNSLPTSIQNSLGGTTNVLACVQVTVNSQFLPSSDPSVPSATIYLVISQDGTELTSNQFSVGVDPKYTPNGYKTACNGNQILSGSSCGCSSTNFINGGNCFTMPANSNPVVSSGGANVGYNCWAGYYNDTSQGTYLCSACPTGTYSAAGSSSCTPCSAGTYSTTPVASSSTACANCPAGTASSIVGANSASACIPCSPNQWSSPGLAACTPCVGCSGASCNAASGCSTCAAGSVKIGASCTSCTAGSTWSAGGSATSCNNCTGCTGSSCGVTVGCTSCAGGNIISGGNCAGCTGSTWSAGGSATSCSACATGMVSGTCASSNYSCVVNASMSSNVCSCNSGYYQTGSSCSACAGGLVTGTCSGTSNYSCVANATMSNNVCSCNSGYYQSGSSCNAC